MLKIYPVKSVVLLFGASSTVSGSKFDVTLNIDNSNLLLSNPVRNLGMFTDNFRVQICDVLYTTYTSLKISYPLRMLLIFKQMQNRRGLCTLPLSL